jgi:Flp pilus assembly protein TadG
MASQDFTVGVGVRLRRVRRAAVRRARREDGQALVELALAMPVLLLLIMAIIQFGLMFSTYTNLTDAARTGARELALGRGLSDPCDLAINQTVKSTAGEFTLPSLDVTPSFTDTTGTTPADSCGTGSGGTYTGGNENVGDEATVSIAYPYTLSVFGMGIMHLTLHASASDAVE